jgi:hypothetical protein
MCNTRGQLLLSHHFGEKPVPTFSQGALSPAQDGKSLVAAPAKP